MTARVDREFYSELKSLQETTGQSVADVLKIGLRRVKADLGPAQEQAYIEGAEAGYEEAREEFEVTYWCSACQERHLSVNTAEQKEAAASLMYHAGWHSKACS